MSFLPLKGQCKALAGFGTPKSGATHSQRDVVERHDDPITS